MPRLSRRAGDVTPDLLIGLPDARPRHLTTLDLPPGAMLCLYTDGLVERRDRPLDDGIRQLSAAVVPSDPEVSCAAVMSAMADFSPHSDDVALLIFRREPQPDAGREAR